MSIEFHLLNKPENQAMNPTRFNPRERFYLEKSFITADPLKVLTKHNKIQQKIVKE